MPKIEIITYTDYTGPYTVTPSESVQQLSTKNKKASDDITVLALDSDVCEVIRDGHTLRFK